MRNVWIRNDAPRLAQRLNRQLRRYRAGELDDDQFSRRFENLLQQQYTWLANQGVPEVEAAPAMAFATSRRASLIEASG